jgi:hypothetical protein
MQDGAVAGAKAISWMTFFGLHYIGPAAAVDERKISKALAMNSQAFIER